jgi:lipid II:glycine glycyltransferase (peptidoglycan interpeptide bridge formation enzyme)
VERESWNQFVLEHGPRSGRFLQSWEWGEFQKSVGEQVWREEFVEVGQTVGVAQWLERRLPFLGMYRFCPKGPIGAWQPRPTKATYVRVEPCDTRLPSYARKSVDVNPAHTRITDLSKTQEELLCAMHPKTRYNIRVAQKHDVHITCTGVPFASIWELFRQTSSRGQFRLHPRGYYETMLASLTGDCRAFLATASHEDTLLAASIMIDFGDTRTYLHGASSNSHRHLMAPYLLHWDLLRDAQRRGLAFYDWWGVAPANASKDHPWSGISRFKRGFPGVEYAAPGTYDLVLRPSRYHFYQCGRSLIRTVRRSAARLSNDV